MSESKPTPGPWSAFVVEETMTVAVDIGPHPSGKRPNVVDWTGFDTCGLPFDQQVANARLIAAAPETAAERDRLKEVNAELLEVLRLTADQALRCEIPEGYGPEFRSEEWDAGYDAAISSARAAIAKASGDVL
jgi:hypothetical protein